MTNILKLKQIYKYIFILYYLMTKIHLFRFNFHFLDNIYIISIFTIFAFILVFMEIIEKLKKKTNIFSKELVLGSIFILIYIISTLLNSNRIPIISSSYLFIFFSIFYSNDGSYNLDTLMNETKNICILISTAISIPSLLSIFIALFEKYTNIIILNTTSFYHNTRLIGAINFYQNPNQVAINSFIGLICSLIVYNRFKKDKIYIIFCLTNIIYILFSDSRSALLALISLIILSVIYIFKKNHINKKLLITILTIVIGFVLSFSIYMSTTNEKRNIFRQINQIKSAYTINDLLNIVTNQRYSLYKEAISIGISSPIYGYGSNSFVKKSMEVYKDKSIAAIYTSEDTHNIFVSTFFYTGIIGLTIIIYIFVLLSKECVTLIKNTSEITSYLFVSCLVGIFIYSNLDLNVIFRTQFNAVVFWMFAGYIKTYNNLSLKI